MRPGLRNLRGAPLGEVVTGRQLRNNANYVTSHITRIFVSLSTRKPSRYSRRYLISHRVSLGLSRGKSASISRAVSQSPSPSRRVSIYLVCVAWSIIDVISRLSAMHDYAIANSCHAK